MDTPTSNPDALPKESSSPLSTDFLATVSHGPGVYQMLGKKEVLYVGKARDLRKRLSQYVHYTGPPHSKTAAMLSRVARVETFLTTTEKEALILEASLIKQHRPRYNVILRDDKNYPLIKVTTSEPWPRVIVTRKRFRDGNRYFGPYASSTAMRATIQLLSRLFPLRRCATMRERSRPCLNFQMNRCLAPCAGKVDSAEYQRMVESIIMILEGKADKVIAKLTAKMTNAAAEQAFEQAAFYRDQIQYLEKTIEHQAVVATHDLDQDVIGFHRQDAAVGIAVLFVRGGMLTGSQTFFLSEPLGDDSTVLTQSILQYYSNDRQPPRELLLPFSLEDQGPITERLAELREGAVTLHTPQRGKRMQLMRMAGTNAAQIFSEQAKKQQSWNSLATALQTKLHLKNRPETIECLDISNLQGRQAVGSLVCFIQGEKAAGRYRHYRIRSQDTPDDYAMMREVLERRMHKAVHENDPLPDLLLLDGGKGQLGVAVDVLNRFDLLNRIDLVAIAEEKEEEGEKLFRPGRKNPILLQPHSPVLLYLMRIRDEAHRFGITHHRRLRSKDQLHSWLDNLQGVGPQRKKLLLRSLGSVQRVLAADRQTLAEIPGIGSRLSEKIYQQLHPNNGSSSDEKV